MILSKHEINSTGEIENDFQLPNKTEKKGGRETDKEGEGEGERSFPDAILKNFCLDCSLSFTLKTTTANK